MGPELHLSFTASVWVSAAFLLATAVLLIPAGAWPTSAAECASTWPASSSSPSPRCFAGEHDRSWLIFSRVIQGGGAALLGHLSGDRHRRLPAARARPRPGHQRDGRVHGPERGAGARGPYRRPSGWRWIFLINLPIGIIVLLWGWLLMPRRDAGRRAPRLGCARLGAAGRRTHLPAGAADPGLGVGLGSPHGRPAGRLGHELRGFVLAERRVRRPFLDMDLLLTIASSRPRTRRRCSTTWPCTRSACSRPSSSRWCRRSRRG